MRILKERIMKEMAVDTRSVSAGQATDAPAAS
jgi:hypothetical protein